MNKRLSIIIIAGIFLVTGIAGVLGSKLEFDYDFEHFFPQNDPDLEFFLEYRKIYENDNDYVLISIGNKEGIFNANFLKKASKFSDELKKLTTCRTCYFSNSHQTTYFYSFRIY